MKIDLDEMAECFSRVSFAILDAYSYVIEPGKNTLSTYVTPSSGIFFPLRGKGRMTFDGVPYEMKPGKLFHTGPNMLLNREIIGSCKWEFVLIHYQIADKEKATFPYALSHYELDSGYNPHINDLLEKLCSACTVPGSLQTLRAKALFFCILDEVLTGVRNRRQESGHDLVEQAMEYMNRHYRKKFSIPNLSRMYGLSSKQFAYLFQKHAHMSPNEYLISQRMNHAKKLLSTTTFSIAEISDRIGYSDPYYFSKLFKKRTGISPSTLRISPEKMPTAN